MTNPRSLLVLGVLLLSAFATGAHAAKEASTAPIAALEAEAGSLAARTLRLDELVARERIADLWRAGPDANTLGAAKALLDLGSLYQRVGPVERAEEVLREAIRIREGIADGGTPTIDVLLRQLDRAIETLRPEDPERETILLRLAESAPTTDDLNRLARYRRALGETELAITTFERALAREDTSDTGEVGWKGLILADLGRELERAGRLDEAESTYRRAVDVVEAALGSRHPQLVRHLTRLGGLYVEAGRYEEAAPLLERALGIDRAAWGDEEAACDCACSGSLRELLATTYRALGREDELRRLPPEPTPRTGSESAIDTDAARVNELRARGRIREALDQARLDVDLARGRNKGDTPEVAERLRTTAWLLLAQGRGAEALDAARDALRILKTDPEAARGRLADLYLVAGNAAGSIRPDDGATDEFLQKELEVRLALGHNQRAASLLQRIGMRSPAAERTPEQVEALERALALWREMAGDTTPEAVTLRTEIALTHLAQQRYDEAEPWIAALLPIAEEQTKYRRQRILEAAERFQETTGRGVSS